jgi:hypothetical protein
MGKPLEEDLAEYLLNLERGVWTKRYNQECLAMWREKYGDLITNRAEAIVKERWKK